MVYPEPQFFQEPEADVHANRIEHSDTRNRLAVQLLKQMRESLTHVIHLLEEGDTAQARTEMIGLLLNQQQSDTVLTDSVADLRTIEGVFDGVSMVGSDGLRYTVPSGYASKSKLVEGDLLKLVMQPDGGHVYKQIGPVERQRLVGILELDDQTKEYFVVCGGQTFRVLPASISYFNGVQGDEIVVLVPRDGSSVWAAVESIVRS